MTFMKSSTRALTVIFGLALSLIHLSRPVSRPATQIPLIGYKLLYTPMVAALTFAALAPQMVNAYAVPEEFRPAPFMNPRLESRRKKGLGRRHTTTTECTDEWLTATAAGMSSPTNTLEPVTVTVTVGLPSSTNPSSYNTASNATYGSTISNGTLAYGSNGVQPSISASRTSTSDIPVSTVDPLLASAQEAQRLNLAFRSLNANDPCDAGERACISTQVAQCSTPSSPSDTPRWVTQTCIIIGSDPNQTPVCAAAPYTGNSTTTPTYRASNSTTSPSPPVSFGCFLPSDLSQLFTNAGAKGGTLPPGTQANAAVRGLRLGRQLGWAGLPALIATMIL